MALSGYDWVDRSKGLARIPIDDAMRIIAARGDHAYDRSEPPRERIRRRPSQRKFAHEARALHL